MDKRNYEVNWHRRSLNSLQKIFLYINNESPDNALKFLEKLYEFGETLGFMPDKYPVCRQKSYRKRNFRCAVFHKNYIFIYQKLTDSVLIRNIVHCKRIR
ncbi:MAG: type II toxin-antitoxin system RelE/ParE family toxin [Bacteroidia bacterium]|nr:type II toxin-antitoxin system RelE/ParE family toxin [Bacteroidia bacterium]